MGKTTTTAAAATAATTGRSFRAELTEYASELLTEVREANLELSDKINLLRLILPYTMGKHPNPILTSKPYKGQKYYAIDVATTEEGGLSVTDTDTWKSGTGF